MKTIHGTITTSVTLGAGGYGAGLKIASDGAIIPSQDGADAVYAPSNITDAHVVNHGKLLGAYGQYSQSGPGGVGILLAGGGNVLNSGLVQGGRADDGQGGAGVLLQAAGQVSNSGTIAGGYSAFGYGGIGVDLTQGGSLNNHGTITGGGAAFPNAGVSLGAAGTVRNFGTITGGRAIIDDARLPFWVSAGLRPFVDGNGVAEGTAVYGIDFLAGGTLINRGTVSGGGGGGGGIRLEGPGQINNFGIIQGGAGEYLAGDGGLAVSLSSGGTLTNHGTITGGSGYSYQGVIGGDGVDLDGGMLIAAAGTIAGGAGFPKGVDGNAVSFGSAVGTLVVDPGAQFIGNIVANTAVNDTLVLSGTAAGTLGGLRTTVTGFTTVTESAHATWKLEGSLSGAGILSIVNGAHLEIAGPVSIATIQFTRGAQNLQLDQPGSVTSTFAGFGTGDSIDLMFITASKLQYANGTLTLLDANGKAVDTLHFAGTYTVADFSLHGITNGTELDYAGPNLPSQGAHSEMAGHALSLWHDAVGMMHDWQVLMGRD